MKIEVYTVNTETRVEKITIDTSRGYISFVGDLYERYRYNESDVKELVSNFIEEIYDLRCYAANPHMSFNNILEDILDDTDEILECIGEVTAYDINDDYDETILDTFELVACGQFTESRTPLAPYWDTLHGKETTVIPQDLLSTITQIMKDVDQVPMWEQLDMIY